MTRRVVVLGGGTGGTLAANRLRRRFDDGDVSITVVDQDNRHVYLEGLQEEAWKIAYVDFTRDGKRNDGSPVPFAAGHLVDDLFFFVEPGVVGGDVDLFVDEVTLFDAARG